MPEAVCSVLTAVVGPSIVIAKSMILATRDPDSQVCWKTQLKGENGKELKQLFKICFISISFLKYSTLFFLLFSKYQYYLLKKEGELIKKENWKMRMPTFPTPPPLSDCSRCTYLLYVYRKTQVFRHHYQRLLTLNYQVDFFFPFDLNSNSISTKQLKKLVFSFCLGGIRFSK